MANLVLSPWVGKAHHHYVVTDADRWRIFRQKPERSTRLACSRHVGD
jgi:hypothetical protein